MLFAQNAYNKPESVVFDESSNTYFISNYGKGNVVVVDTNYVVIDTLASNLSYCLGVHLKDNVLYVSCDKNLQGFDITTKNKVFDLNIQNITWLDGITSDNSGYLYVVNAGATIIRVNINEISYSTFVTGLPASCQDIEFDERNNRLLVVAWSRNSSIMSIDLSTQVAIKIPNTNIGRFDGITMDQNGNTYVATHTLNGEIYKFDIDFSKSGEKIEGNFNKPAGVHYNKRDNILVVPNFGGNNVIFIPILATTSVRDVCESSASSMIGNYPNPFHSSTTIFFPPNNMNTEIVIYNLKGKIVKYFSTVQNQTSVFWNGNNNQNIPVPSGTYFYKLIVNGKMEAAKKCLLLK
ncbi:T9SS type A sorting domain-containing protein [bacterium]|nr:T9SS type A sorting domain-containing protein [bacterium]